MINRPGALAKACAVLSDNGVNLQAISVIEHNDHGVLRIIADNPNKAILLLEQEGLMLLEQDVVTLKIDNTPGALTRITQKLALADINVAYAYASATDNATETLLILRTDDLEKTNELLSKIGS